MIKLLKTIRSLITPSYKSPVHQNIDNYDEETKEELDKLLSDLRGLYQQIYVGNVDITGELAYYLNEIEKIIACSIPTEVKKILICYGSSQSNLGFSGDPIPLVDLYEMYINMDFKDDKVLDYTFAYKRELIDNFTIDKDAENPLTIENPVEAQQRLLKGKNLDDEKYFENFYDLSKYIPIAHFEGRYTLIDISEPHQGRIIRIEYDDYCDVYLAPSFELHLKDLIEGLESGRYQLEYEGYIDYPEWYERFTPEQLK